MDTLMSVFLFLPFLAILWAVASAICFAVYKLIKGDLKL